MEIRNRYRKLIDLIVLFLIIAGITLLIKYYFKPFLSMILIFFIVNPIYNLLQKLQVPKKIGATLCILFVNIAIIIFILYLGNSIYEIIIKIYERDIKEVEKVLEWIFNMLNIKEVNSSIIKVLNSTYLKEGAVSTGEAIAAYFIGNIAAFFLLIDRDKFKDLLIRLIPKDIVKKIMKQKRNFKEMAFIEITLVLISTIEIIFGFLILRVPRPVFLGIICGVLDILPYVGTIIVFIPIIIYNIIVRRYLIALGLITLYILVQVIREILEAKFLSDKLELHPLLVLLSIYIGIKLFGLLGVVVGPMYGILAKEIIYGG